MAFAEPDADPYYSYFHRGYYPSFYHYRTTPYLGYHRYGPHLVGKREAESQPESQPESNADPYMSYLRTVPVVSHTYGLPHYYPTFTYPGYTAFGARVIGKRDADADADADADPWYRYSYGPSFYRSWGYRPSYYSGFYRSPYWGYY